MKRTDWIKQLAIFVPSFIIALFLIKGIFLNGEMGFMEYFILFMSMTVLLLAFFLDQNKVNNTILCLGLLSLMIITYYRAANDGSILFGIVVIYLIYHLHRFNKQEALQQ